jgi:hypothetical protein
MELYLHFPPVYLHRVDKDSYNFIFCLVLSLTWLRRCATSRTVPGSILGGVTGFFSDIFPSDRTMALGSTQPLVKMSTRIISWG